MIDSRHFAELIAEEKISPRGEERADLRMAILGSTMANMWSKRRYTVQQFMPKFDRKQQSAREMHMQWKAFVADHNKRQNRKGQ